MDHLSILVLCVAMGTLTRSISRSRGYEGGFWWGFCLNVFGLLVVALRPARKAFSKVLQEGSAAAVQAFGDGSASISAKPNGMAFDQIPNGTRVKVLNCTNDGIWALVQHQGKEGYIKTMYLSEMRAEE